MGDEDGNGGDSAPFGIEKAKSALCCCCLGIVLLPAMLIMLGSNEKGYVCRDKDLIYADTSANEVGCTGTPPNDQFVFFSCEIETSKLRSFTLRDFNPGFEADLGTYMAFNSTAASQTVEMYQCMESSASKKTGSGKDAKTVTTYSNRLGWNSQVKETGFHDLTAAKAACGTNFAFNPKYPTNVAVSSPTKRMDGGVPVGMFKLHATLSDSFQADTKVSLGAFASKFVNNVGAAPVITGASQQTMPLITKNKIRPIGDFFMTCETPHLGCVRISLKQNGATYASALVNSGTGGNTASQPTKSSWGCSSGNFAELFKSKKTKAEALSSLKSGNNSSLWAMRIIGVLLCWAAVFCCMYPIIAAFDIVGDYLGKVPCVGCLLKMIADIVETLVKIVVCCMSCSFGCSCAFFVIAVVWVVMRPTVGIFLLITVVVLTVGAFLLMKFVPKKGDKVEIEDEEAS